MDLRASSSFDRLRLRVMTGLCLAFATLLVPLTGYRMAHGEYPRAVFNAVIALVCVAIVVHVRRSGRVERMAQLLAGLILVGSVVSQLLDRRGIAPWLYPCLVTYFLILPRRQATWMAGITTVGAAAALAWWQEAPTITVVTLFTTLAWSTGLMLTLAFEVDQRQAVIERMATRDPLTGAGNRRALERALREAEAEQQRHGTPVSLLALDLDHFKTVNDRHGHEAGDRLLVDTVALLEGRARVTDHVYRTGGEEFIMLLRHTGEEQARVLAESLRALFAQRLAVAGTPVTGSFGCAERRPGEALSAWMVRADRALYAAKRQGRDRVVMAATLEDAPDGARAGTGDPSPVAVP